MDALKEFIIPIEGLSEGVHQFDFQLDQDFFNHFKNDLIAEGQFDLKLYFDKRPDMIVLTFDFDGAFRTACDRCLEHINVPLRDRQQMMIKYADDLQDITAKEFCQEVELKPSYGTEFSKMRNLTNRLKQAGLDVTKI